jgi:Xaa-Pro aminopeptidase
MRPEIIARQRQIIAANGLDALIAVSPENFAWTAGFVVPSQPILRWRHAMVVVKADGTYAVACVDMEETMVRNRLPGVELRVWGEFEFNAMPTLAALLTDMGLGAARIGIEMDYLPAGDFDVLRKGLPAAKFSAAEQLLARSRQLKTPEEIVLLRKLSRIADSSITDAFAAVAAGSTELDIAAAMTRGVYTQGADQFRLMIVATGERSVFPNVGPTERKLRPQDVCRVEIFSMLNGYHAGVCRTAVVQSAPPNAERIWDNLVACKYLILDMIKPGASSRAIYEAFLKKLSELDLPPISFVGHGIGLHLHEDPYLGKYSDTSLEAGMVLGIEPLVYRTPYGFGMQLKDMVLVTDIGSELLSDYAKTDKLLVVR